MEKHALRFCYTSCYAFDTAIIWIQASLITTIVLTIQQQEEVKFFRRNLNSLYI
jgi:hypothetical protein